MKTIDIFGAVGDAFEGFTVQQMAAELDGHEGPLTVRINSPGGFASDGISIYNMLKPHAPRIEVLGLAASAASIIAMAGGEIHVAEAARLMIHNAWSIAVGNSRLFTKAASILSQLDDELVGVYASRSGQSRQQIAEWMDSDTYFTGPEAVAAGLATSYGGDAEDDPEETAEVLAVLGSREYAGADRAAVARRQQQVARNTVRLLRANGLCLTNGCK
jgi:ATP-dependent protease ClpP protease subunit